MWIVSGIFRDQDTKETLPGVVHRLLKPGQTYKAGRGKEHLLSFAAKYASSEHFSIRVGEHTETQAADSSYIPRLTLVAQPRGPPVKPGGTPKTFAVYLIKRSESGKLITEGGEFELSDGDEIRINKPDGVAVSLHWKPVVLHNIFDTADEKKNYTSYIPALASMGIKTRLSSSDLQTHTVLSQITEFSAPIIRSVTHHLQLISPRWISYIVGAGDPGQEEGEKFWSPAELDFNTSWPSEDDFRPEIKFDSKKTVWSGWKSLLAKIRTTRLDQETLFGGLSLYVLVSESDNDLMTAILELTQTLGATCIIQNPILKIFADVTSLRTALEKAKREADSRYAKHLRDTGKSLTEESKGSGLLLLSWSKDMSDLQNVKTGVEWTDLEQIATELGLVWLDQFNLFRAILEADLGALLKSSRTDEQPFCQSLPSQVGDSIGSSDSFPKRNPRVYARPSSSVTAGPPLSKLTRRTVDRNRNEEMQVSIQDGDNEVGSFGQGSKRTRAPPQTVESLIDTAVAPVSGSLRKPLVRRKPVHRAPLDDLVASLLDEDDSSSTPASASSSLLTTASTTKHVEEPGFYARQFAFDSKGNESGLSSRRLVRRDLPRQTPDETYSYTDDPSIIIEESSKARQVYDKIRESAKNLDVPMLMNNEGDDDDDDGEEDFIEESKRKIRLKKEQERRREQETTSLDRREKGEQPTLQQRMVDETKSHTTEIVVDKRGPQSGSPPIINGSSSPSAHSPKCPSLPRKPSDREMPPPTMIPRRNNEDEDNSIGRKKRAAEDGPDFLIAPSKRKKGLVIDPLDAEFNKLKLAKQNIGDRDTREDDEHMEEDKSDGFAMVCVVKPLLRKDSRVERPVTDHGAIPNFKKFKKQHVVRSAPIKLVGVQVPSIRGHKIRESPSITRIPESTLYPPTPSLPTSNPTQSFQGPRLSQRKRLLRAQSESDDEVEGMNDRRNPSKRAKTGEGPINLKSIVLSSDDDGSQIVQSQCLERGDEEGGDIVEDQLGVGKCRTRTPAGRGISRTPMEGGTEIGNVLELGANRKKLLLIGSDSEDEVGGFKGFGGARKAGSRRR